MNARTSSRTLVIAACLGCAGIPLQSWAHPQPSDATPQPGSPEAVKGKETDFVQAWGDLVERYQPQGGKDAAAPNAHDSLVRLVVLVERVEQKVVKAAQGTPPDFMLVYSPRGGDVPGDEASQERAAAVAMLKELDRSRFDVLLTELVERVRAVTPRLDSPQRAAELWARGIRVTESAISDFIGARSPELLKARQVARINFARMHQAAAAGDWDRTVRSFEQSLALARVLSHEPSHLDRITAGRLLQRLSAKCVTTSRNAGRLTQSWQGSRQRWSGNCAFLPWSFTLRVKS